jgi:hypothetical protein
MRKPNLKTLFLLLLVAVSLQACIKKPGIWSNSQISQGNLDDFHTMNAGLLEALKRNNTDSINSFLSKQMIEDVESLRKEELVSNALKSNNYSLLDEYYVIKDYAHTDSTTTIKPVHQGKNAYGISFSGAAGETYLALYLPKTGDNRSLICLEYYKYNYGWKLSSLDMGAYNINGKTAPELYEIAKAEYAKKYLVNAINTMQLADYCMSPCLVWQYPNEKEMSKFYSDLTDEGNKLYKFPFVVEKITTHPKIFNIANVSVDGTIYPTVYYISNIKVSDTTGLKKENEQMRKILGDLVPGIDKDKSSLVYSAYNEMPSSTKVVKHFDMTEKF